MSEVMPAREAAERIRLACEEWARQLTIAIQPIGEMFERLAEFQTNHDSARHRPGDPEW